jgi:transcriptional regulator with XRE-family HTH domain
MSQMEPEVVSLGARIRAARTALDLTQADLAYTVGLSRSSIANIETGRQEPPALTLGAIARALKTTTGDLLGERPAPLLPTVRIRVRCSVECATCGIVADDLGDYEEARKARAEHRREHLNL